VITIIRVLLVDDEPLIIEGLKKLINWDELGIECCFEANNGIQALDIIRKKRPSIMICDIRMQEMDGIELLQKVRGEGFNTKIIVLSGYNQFEYIKTAMKYEVENYLLKPVDKEELTSTLNSIIDTMNNELYNNIRQRESFNILRENILNRILINRINTNEFEDKAEMLGLKLNKPFYTVVVFDFIYLYSDTTQEEYKWKAYAIFNIVEELVRVDRAGEVFQLLSGGIAVILNHNSIEQRPFEKLLLSCLENINKHLNVDALVSVGGTVKEIELIHISYKDASRLLHYRYTNKKNRVIYYGFEKEAANKTRMLLKTAITDIEDFIISCDREKTFELLDKVLKELSFGHKIKPLQIEDICTEIAFFVSNVIKRCKLSLEDVMGEYDRLADILKYDDIYGFFDRMKELCSNIIRCLENKKRSAFTIHEIVDYINTNYTQDMSIKLLSVKFNISPAYLGQLVRNETGETFSDFLNKLRVKKAKEIILTTNKNVNEICFMVGYCDPNYFCKVFKKYTGMNPSQFKIK
jgi:two-component system response regulator YesN